VEEIPFQERIWPKDGAWRLVQACRLIPKKGLRTSLRAFAELVRQYPDATFSIAGEGPLLEQLQAQAVALGIAEKVFFPGFLSQRELRDLFYRSNIFLHPSETGADGNQEGVPNSMLEAMASGLPVFATAHGGIPEAIEDGKSGVLVAEGDHAALAAKLLELVREPERLSDLGRRGSATVAQEFNQDIQTRKLEDHYFEAMSGRSG
jgi:glycosyltransferase involved in cell wall biosynthesis